MSRRRLWLRLRRRLLLTAGRLITRANGAAPRMGLAGERRGKLLELVALREDANAKDMPARVSDESPRPERWRAALARLRQLTGMRGVLAFLHSQPCGHHASGDQPIEHSAGRTGGWYESAMPGRTRQRESLVITTGRPWGGVWPGRCPTTLARAAATRPPLCAHVLRATTRKS